MKKRISVLTIIGLVIGVVLGLVLKTIPSYIELIGTWYVKVLKFFICPVLFTSIAYTIYETSKKKNGLVIKAVLLFIVMYSFTFLLTSLIVTLINPANGFIFEEVEWSGETTKFSLFNMFVNLFPKNLKEIFISPKVFAIILFAYIFGKVMSYVRNADSFMKGLADVKAIIYKALEYFMHTTPLATMSLMAVTVNKYGSILLGVGFKYILVAWIAGIISLIVIMIVPLKFIVNISFKEYVKKVYKIWIMTITTCSSAATLPYTVKLCKEEFDIPSQVTDVVVPLGCTIHMCGGAVSFALLGLFSAKLYGVEIGLGTYLLMLLSSLLINMAAPGIPNGGIVIGASYLQMMGIPLGFIGFYSGIYKFLDMCYTSLNVTGDISANIILNKYLKKS